MPSVEDCGPYPAASSFADTWIDGNGGINYHPLTAAQNAQYQAAISAYYVCLGQAQATPPCPEGQFFSGSLVAGVWQGQCVSIYTGAATTPVVEIPEAPIPGQQPQSPYAVAPAGTTTPPTPVPKPTPATPPKITTPPAATTPASSTRKLHPQDLFFGDGGNDVGGYCQYFPDDPYCDFGGTLGGLLGGIFGGTVSNTTTIVQQSGLLATDVHNIVNDALTGLWGVVVGVLDLALAGAIAAVQKAVTALGNALKAAWNILSRLSGLILKFLDRLWHTIIHGIVLALQDIFGWLKTLYRDILKPALLELQKIRQKILDIWKRYVVPVLIVIQDIRKVLAILAVFHVKWAAKLDAKLADLERKITAPLITLLGYINQLGNWMNLLVTVGYLLQKPLWLNTFKAYAGSSLNLQINAMNGPLSAATVRSAQAAANAPTAQQSKADLTAFLQNGGGTFAAPIVTAQTTFDEFLQQNG